MQRMTTTLEKNYIKKIILYKRLQKLYYMEDGKEKKAKAIYKYYRHSYMNLKSHV